MYSLWLVVHYTRPNHRVCHDRKWLMLSINDLSTITVCNIHNPCGDCLWCQQRAQGTLQVQFFHRLHWFQCGSQIFSGISRSGRGKKYQTVMQKTRYLFFMVLRLEGNKEQWNTTKTIYNPLRLNLSPEGKIGKIEGSHFGDYIDFPFLARQVWKPHSPIV